MAAVWVRGGGAGAWEEVLKAAEVVVGRRGGAGRPFIGELRRWRFGGARAEAGERCGRVNGGAMRRC